MPSFGTRQDVFVIASALLACNFLKCFYKARNARQRGLVIKPQAYFTKVLADNSDSPFEHRSRREQVQNGPQISVSVPNEEKAHVGYHPFGKEILELANDDIPDVISGFKAPPSVPEAITCTPWEWVSTVEQLESVRKELRGAQQIALDLEHHALRSYLGIACLLQLSTGEKEYLIDTLTLHDHMHLLQDVLEDKAIPKVLHGGENDILWLQRDFHIYLVNVFDTEKACQVLGYEERSLAHLLHKFCGVTANKQHQLADWRARPLAEELVEYARTDVHFLLYIANVLRAELAARGQSVLQDSCRRSHAMALTLYTKPTSQAAVAGAVNAVLRKQAAAGDSSAAGPRLVDCVFVLCRWRDDMARRQDESPQYIMPDALLLGLAKRPPSNPEDLAKQFSGAAALWSTPAEPIRLLKSHADELCSLLEEAQLGMHPWQPGAAAACAAAAGKQRRTAEEAAERRKKLVASFCAKGPVYENCRMLSMDGAPLSFIDLRKLQWYEARGLAERVSDNPPTIRLLFRHKAADQVTGADAFYGERKLNCCVACGNSDNYLRYRVVPACYRRYFPVHLKSHRSHDVVLLCFDCHQTAHQAAERMKQTISREYGIPLMPPVPPPPRSAVIAGMPEKALHPTNIRRTALALQYHAATMPPERRQKLTALVRAYVRGSTADAAGHEALTDEELQEGLMAGFGARARRKLMQRHAASLAANKVEADVSADLAEGRSSAADATAAFSPDGSSGAPTSVNTDSVDRGVSENGALPAAERGVEPGMCEEAVSSSTLSAGDRDEGQKLADKFVGSEGVQESATEEVSETPAAAAARDLNKGGHQWHGRKVVEAVLERGGEEELCTLMARFRQCFVDALHPQHLSPSWQIDHSAKRAFGDYSVYSTS
ncbi:probable exosome component 10 at N-terminal half [Coccomyxa sp. Obi]|nr:probable exosome component 10 at N-terminal half [Coccomyxa sp. Obi]